MLKSYKNELQSATLSLLSHSNKKRERTVQKGHIEPLLCYVSDQICTQYAYFCENTQRKAILPNYHFRKDLRPVCCKNFEKTFKIYRLLLIQINNDLKSI